MKAHDDPGASQGGRGASEGNPKRQTRDATDALVKAAKVAGNVARDVMANVSEDTRAAVADAAARLSGSASDAAEAASQVAHGGFLLMESLLLIAAFGIMGIVADSCFPSASDSCTPGWALGMLLGGYIVLVPGVFSTLFSFELDINLGDLTYTVTRDNAGSPGPTTESVLTMVTRLFDGGMYVGAALVAGYGIGIPLLKLVLLLLGELWRDSDDVGKAGLARGFILSVKALSKWASPDMFAYVLLLFLFRSMTFRIPSSPFSSTASLDLGFLCYAVFCIVSTVVVLAVPVPSVPGSPPSPRSLPVEPPWVVRAFGNAGASVLVWGFAVLSALLLFAGIHAPCMSLLISSEALVAPQGPIPAQFAGLLRTQILDLGSSSVSVWRCIETLAEWYLDNGETNLAVALGVIAIFVVLLTSLDLMVILAAGMHLARGAPVASVVDKTRVLKHLAMLDVFVMGILVVGLASSLYRDSGVVIDMKEGLWFLLAAEILHYLAHSIIVSTETVGFEKTRALDEGAEVKFNSLGRAAAMDAGPLSPGPEAPPKTPDGKDL